MAVSHGRDSSSGGMEEGQPKRVVSDSAASRKAVVSMALPLLASMGTWTNDLWRVSNHVPPAGYVDVDVDAAAIFGMIASLL